MAAALYRIAPMLWTDATGGGAAAQTVYAIDRAAPGLATACTRRPKEDPASTWEGTTVLRLLPPPSDTSGARAVTWATLPSWLSYAQSQGYTIGGAIPIHKLTPYSDFYISGP
jgi:hypothetical protein